MVFGRHKLGPQLREFDLENNISLAGRTLGKVTARCRHDRPSSSWGALAKYRPNQSQPAWLLWVDLHLEQLTTYKLALATITLDIKQPEDGTRGTLVTNFYGPNGIDGPSVKWKVHKAAILKQLKASAMGAAAEVGGELGWSLDQARAERWHFTATVEDGTTTTDGKPRAIKWRLEEAGHATDIQYRHDWKLGAVLEHDGRPFNMEFNIAIQLAGLRRFLLLRNRSETHLFRVTPPANESVALDAKAEALNDTLLDLNRMLPPSATRNRLVRKRDKDDAREALISRLSEAFAAAGLL